MCIPFNLLLVLLTFTYACDFMYIIENQVQIGVGSLEPNQMNKRQWWSGELTSGEQFSLYYSGSIWTLDIADGDDFFSVDRSGPSLPANGQFITSTNAFKSLTFECHYGTGSDSVQPSNYCAFIDMSCGGSLDGRYLYSHYSQSSGPVYVLQSSPGTELVKMELNGVSTWTIDASDQEETILVSDNSGLLFPNGKTVWRYLRKDNLQSAGINAEKCDVDEVTCTLPENTETPTQFPSNSPSAPPLKTEGVEFSGQYSEVIGDLSNFLQECSKMMTPVYCIYAQPSGATMSFIEITFQGTAHELSEALAEINSRGSIQVNGYPALPTISEGSSSTSSIDSTTTTRASTMASTDKETTSTTPMTSTEEATSTTENTEEPTSTMENTEEPSSTTDVTEAPSTTKEQSTSAPVITEDPTIPSSESVSTVKMQLTFTGLTREKFEESKRTIRKVVADAAEVQISDVSVELISRRIRRALQDSIVEATVSTAEPNSVLQSLDETSTDELQQNFAEEAERAGITGISLQGVSDPVISVDSQSSTSSSASITQRPTTQPESTEGSTAEEGSDASDKDFMDLLIMILAGILVLLLVCCGSYCIYTKYCVDKTHDNWDFNNYGHAPSVQNVWYATKRTPEEDSQVVFV